MLPYPVPSGSDTETVKAYYDYLLGWHLRHIPEDRATTLLWSSPEKVLFWFLLLVIVFFLYAYAFNRAHRKSGNLYGATSFAGSLLERNGTVTAFTWFIIIGLFLAGLYLGIKYVLLGYLY